MIEVIQYSVGKGKGCGWKVVFKSDNKPLKRYVGLDFLKKLFYNNNRK